jgi:hypothetical protein
MFGSGFCRLSAEAILLGFLLPSRMFCRFDTSGHTDMLWHSCHFFRAVSGLSIVSGWRIPNQALAGGNEVHNHRSTYAAGSAERSRVRRKLANTQIF